MPMPLGIYQRRPARGYLSVAGLSPQGYRLRRTKLGGEQFAQFDDETPWNITRTAGLAPDLGPYERAGQNAIAAPQGRTILRGLIQPNATAFTSAPTSQVIAQQNQAWNRANRLRTGLTAAGGVAGLARANLAANQEAMRMRSAPGLAMEQARNTSDMEQWKFASPAVKRRMEAQIAAGEGARRFDTGIGLERDIGRMRFIQGPMGVEQLRGQAERDVAERQYVLGPMGVERERGQTARDVGRMQFIEGPQTLERERGAQQRETGLLPPQVTVDTDTGRPLMVTPAPGRQAMPVPQPQPQQDEWKSLMVPGAKGQGGSVFTYSTLTGRQVPMSEEEQLAANPQMQEYEDYRVGAASGVGLWNLAGTSEREMRKMDRLWDRTPPAAAGVPAPHRSGAGLAPDLAPAPPAPQAPGPVEGTIIRNQKTGERRIFKGGQWVPLQG